jgi:hypothetical protein
MREGFTRAMATRKANLKTDLLVASLKARLRVQVGRLRRQHREKMLDDEFETRLQAGGYFWALDDVMELLK